VRKYIINLYEAKTNLSALVERVAEGEEIVIAKAGVPKARLIPVSGPHKRRRPGGWKGKIRIGKDFDESLPADILRMFTGEGDGKE